MNGHEALILDFLTSRKSLLRSPQTLEYYENTASKFIEWLGANELTGASVRLYLTELTERGCADGTVHAHARAIRALVNFGHDENYFEKKIKVRMPTVRERNLPVLNSDQLMEVAEIAHVTDRALILLMADTGLRRNEVVSLEWEDIDFETGRILVTNGKGGKIRTVFMGKATSKALSKYQKRYNGEGQVFPIEPRSLTQRMRRLSNKVGIEFTPHALRRTFATMSLRNGLNVLSLQRMMGHTTLAMTTKYVKYVDEDLRAEHLAHGPIDQIM